MCNLSPATSEVPQIPCPSHERDVDHESTQIVSTYHKIQETFVANFSAGEFFYLKNPLTPLFSLRGYSSALQL